MPFMFENLEVYQKSVDLAETIINLTDTFPKGFQKIKMKWQLNDNF